MLNNNRGFTLIEMLIVLMIITVLIILIVPNLSGRSADVNDKGCEALVALVQSQADAYFIESGLTATDISTLVPNYITDKQTTCPNGNELSITNGKVSL
ncbi:competence type IV pilus major pilin ComGC [Oceanobacillus chungangensis]|uniref:ComG operon protein 3 n=1 Tax=Oceanobacillus chungangensis TaxID=1229152 RepID=A0A3D8Q0Y4_9BACI|nr:competence type IV pilus major pilin ComGC [Oceanobacillus chungangensis]RDW21934.1 prepilin-type cleavage/methylation domain-containing protein [Oceanobacillus chungangensis]